MDEAEWAGQGDGFFDVEVEAGQRVSRDEGFEREVVSFELERRELVDDNLREEWERRLMARE